MAFFWDGNTGQIRSPQQAAKQRAVAEALLSQSQSGASNWGEGLARVAQAFTSGQLSNRVSDAEAAGQARAAELFGGLRSGASSDAILAALLSPDAQWGTDIQNSVAQALLSQAAQREDPMYQMQLEKAGLELNALRNPAAPKPVYEGGQWWDISGGAPSALTDRVIDPTSLMTNVGAAGFEPGTPEYQAAILSGIQPAQTNINVAPNGQQFANPPFGMDYLRNPDGTVALNAEGMPQIIQIPGGPQSAEAQAIADASAANDELGGRTANLVREDINRIKNIVRDAPWYNPAVGFGSKLASAIEGSNATNVAALSKTVLANIGFDRLQQMREASPTGGALGAISDRELGTLQAVMGNLEQSQSVDQFMFNLDRLGELYDGILQKASAYPNAREFGMNAPSAQTTQGAGSMSQMPTFSTEAEFIAAPSGTVFKAPDGSIRVKK